MFLSLKGFEGFLASFIDLQLMQLTQTISLKSEENELCNKYRKLIKDAYKGGVFHDETENKT